MSQLPLEVPAKRSAGVTLPDAIRLQARERIAHAVELGNMAWAKLRVWPMPLPTVSFDLRGLSAGQAVTSKEDPHRRHLRLNAEMMLKAPREMLQVTIPHEVAHLLVRYFFGPDCASHGTEWQRVMRSLGQEPERTHNMPGVAARVVPRPYTYRCACQVHHLTAVRHKRRYKCNACGEPLVFVSGPPDTAKPRSTLQRVAAPAPMPPTEKQLAFARGLAARHKTQVPATALKDKRALSMWISAINPSAAT